MPIRKLLVAAVLLTLLPGVARAQADSPNGPAPLCFRGRPAEQCRVFLLTEVSLNSREYGADSDDEVHLRSEVGAMVNVGERSAAGGTVSFGWHWGATARYRRWLHGGLAVDFAPGFVVVRNAYDGRSLRLTANISISAGDWAGAFAHGESSRNGGQAGVGLKLGSWLGTIAGGVLYGLILIIPET